MIGLLKDIDMLVIYGALVHQMSFVIIIHSSVCMVVYLYSTAIDVIVLNYIFKFSRGLIPESGNFCGKSVCVQIRGWVSIYLILFVHLLKKPVGEVLTN